MTVVSKLKNKYKNLTLMQRMIFVYMLGFVLPLIFVYLYLYSTTRNTLMEQELADEMSRLDTDSERLLNVMAVVEEYASNFYFDEMAGKLVLERESTSDDLAVNGKEFEELKKYTQMYYPDIADVQALLYEPEYPSVQFDNQNFIHITEPIEEAEWFKATENSNGAPYWSYITDVRTGKKSIRLTRLLFTRDDKVSGVISVSLVEQIGEGLVERDDALAFVKYAPGDIVYSNGTITDVMLSKIMENVEQDDFSGWIEIDGKRSMIASIMITPRFGGDAYYIVSVKSYDDILKLVNHTAIAGIIPILLAFAIGTFAVLLLSKWFSNRLNSFKDVMHEAANGNYDIENAAIGTAHDEIWALNKDLKLMINDIRELNDTAAMEKIRNEQIHSRQKDVEFKMLATQINPHFLYNTLENIRMLALINKQPEIADISFTLTKLLRKSLNVGNEDVTLLWEMEMVEYYIRIQEYRFGDRIHANIDYDKNLAARYKLMPLVIQPFVENAYVHAMEDKEANGVIDIKAVIDDKIYIDIEDNGHGMPNEKLAEIKNVINDFDNLDRTHIGICNVNQRIKLRFGDDYGVDFDSTEGVGTRVKITLPLISDKNL